MAATQSPTSPSRRHSGRHSGRRVVIDAGVALAQLGVLTNSLVIWFFASLTFFGEPLWRPDYVHMTVGFGLGAALLLLGFVPVRVLGCAGWVWVTGAVGTGICLVGVAVSAVTAMQASPARFESEPWWWPLEVFAWLPMSWPMALLLVGSTFLATGRSLPTPR